MVNPQRQYPALSVPTPNEACAREIPKDLEEILTHSGACPHPLPGKVVRNRFSNFSITAIAICEFIGLKET